MVTVPISNWTVFLIWIHLLKFFAQLIIQMFPSTMTAATTRAASARRPSKAENASRDWYADMSFMSNVWTNSTRMLFNATVNLEFFLAPIVAVEEV